MGQLRAPGLAQVAARPPRRGHCSPRASYLHGASGSGSGSGCGSAAPSPGLQRARRLRLRVRQPRSAINTRGRRLRGRASRAGGGRPRSEPSKVARGGGEGGAGGAGGERAQGRHGRLDAGPIAARAGRSSAKPAVAAFSPRAPAERPQPSARAGRATSEAGELEVKAAAPLPGPGPAPRRGEQGRRAARAAGTAGELQPPPVFGLATCASARPAQLRPGGRCARGRLPGALLPDPGEPTLVLRLNWSYGQRPYHRAAPPNQALEALETALRHQGNASPAAVVESDIRAKDKRTEVTRSSWRAIVAWTLQVSC